MPSSRAGKSFAAHVVIAAYVCSSIIHLFHLGIGLLQQENAISVKKFTFLAICVLNLTDRKHVNNVNKFFLTQSTIIG
jgi:hypothetical protein